MQRIFQVFIHQVSEKANPNGPFQGAKPNDTCFGIGIERKIIFDRKSEGFYLNRIYDSLYNDRGILNFYFNSYKNSLNPNLRWQKGTKDIGR